MTYSHLLPGVGRQAAEAAMALVPRSTVVPASFAHDAEDDDGLSLGGERPGQKGCAIRDSNPEPAD
jgi:hypothetical protein